jgi:hypothetical protein
MRTLIVGLLFCASATAAASAQSSSVTTTAPVSAQSSSVTTIVERDRQGRVSIITSRSEDGTARTEFIYTPTGSQETTTFEPAERGYHPLGHGGYHPLGR